MTLEVVGGVLGKSSGADNFLQMPSVAGDLMVESGSNADGAWTKWADGTMHAGKEMYATVSDGSVVTQLYPVPFINTDVSVVISTRRSSSDGVLAYPMLQGTVSATTFDSRLVYTNASGFGVSLNYIAQGRWK